MQATSTPQRQPTITEQARRAQIVNAAIGTIVELGYPKASFTQIAKRAGLSSTGLISYHFRSKQALNQAIATTIFTRLTAHMERAMAGTESARAALVAYIQGLIGFMRADPEALQALMALVLHGALHYDAEAEQEATSGLVDILQRGQAEGIFRSFDVTVMATTIQRALDGIPLIQAAHPDLDLDAYARELVEIFTLATRAPS